MPSEQREVIASTWQRHLLTPLTFHRPCRHTMLSMSKVWYLLLFSASMPAQSDSIVRCVQLVASARFVNSTHVNMSVFTYRYCVCPLCADALAGPLLLFVR